MWNLETYSISVALLCHGRSPISVEDDPNNTVSVTGGKREVPKMLQNKSMFTIKRILNLLWTYLFSWIDRQVPRNGG